MQEPQDQNLKRYITISAGVHASLFLLATIGNFFAPKSTLFLPTVQIDLVALPDQVKQQNPEPLDLTKPVKEDTPPPPSAEEQVEPKGMPDLQREREAEKRAKGALERMREQLKKEQREDQARKTEAMERRKADLKRFENTYRSAIRGNKVNQGTSSTGVMEATMNAYAGHVTERLRSHWALPAYLQAKGFRTIMRIYIDGRGNVARMQLTQSSGNNVFDEYVEGTIRRSSPFAPPPEEMSQGLRSSGMEVLFPL